MKSERFSGTPSDVSFPEYSELRPGDGEVKVPASVFEEHNSIGTRHRSKLLNSNFLAYVLLKFHCTYIID